MCLDSPRPPYRSHPTRIGGNRLTIGEIDDREQHDDARADGHDVGDPGESERNQQGERGFGAVRGGAEGVEPEDGDSGGHSHLFAPLVGGGEGLAEQDIENAHRSRMARPDGASPSAATPTNSLNTSV